MTWMLSPSRLIDRIVQRRLSHTTEEVEDESERRRLTLKEEVDALLHRLIARRDEEGKRNGHL